MSKTIAELIAEGKTVEEITALAEKEAAAAQKRAQASAEEIKAARTYIINDALDYIELLTGEETTDEDAAQLIEEMKPVFEMWESAVKHAMNNKKKPMNMAKKKNSDNTSVKRPAITDTGLNFLDFLL